MAKALAYARERQRFGVVTGWSQALAVLSFLGLGGLGLAQTGARWLAAPLGQIGVGLAFFALLALLSGAFELPFDLYATFVIEERHGFNRQTPRGFVIDRLKGLALGAVLGGLLLGGLLWIMERSGAFWWLWAWGLVTAFSVLAAWAYPSVLAPLFNRFTPLPPGELAERIQSLADQVGFRTRGVFVMDASRRSAHGNAYFTGVFGARRIVLFDTLLDGLAAQEVVAVLAHELGHFKLRHVRWALLRGTLMTGAWLFTLSLCLASTPFYQAFRLSGPSSYAGLVVFGLWFGPVGFLLQPLANHLSRRNEFAADAFAVACCGGPRELGDALLKLRERSRSMPLAHPVYSRVYHSHPPLSERLAAMGYR